MAFLSANGLHKSFHIEENEIAILRDCSLEISEGEFISIVGSSGSGKTTLLTLLAGLDKPSKGEVVLEGQVLSSMSEDELADLRSRRIGYVFQAFNLIESLSAKENVMFPLELQKDANAEKKAIALLEEVGLGKRIDHFPHQLSGGEQQRVALARAVIHHPAIIFADEPTGNLDSKNGKAILKLLLQLQKKYKTALVIVTHDESIAKQADRSITMVDGKIQ